MTGSKKQTPPPFTRTPRWRDRAPKAKIPIALATFASALAVSSVARAEQVRIHAVGNVVFHDPNKEIYDNPGTQVSLDGCRNSSWPTAPLAAAYVQLREEGFPSSPVRGEGWTDANGNFDVSHLQNGSPAVGDVASRFYIQVWTQDTQAFNRVDVHTWDGVTFKLDSQHHGIHHFDRNAAVQGVDIGTIDFDATDDAVLRCAGTVYAHVRNAYARYNFLTDRPRVPADDGHVSVTFGWGTDGMWTYWNNIRIESAFNAWDLQEIYHEFGHRIAFGADSPHDTLAFLDDAARFNYARSHDGTELRATGYAWAEGWADFNHAVFRPEYQPVFPNNGGAGDGVNDDVENDVGRKLLKYAALCGGPGGVAAGYKSFVDTLLANPGPSLAAAHRTSSMPIHSFQHFAALHNARTGCAFTDTGSTGAPISSTDRPDPLLAAVQGGAVSLVRDLGSHYYRSSSINGQQWSLDSQAAQASVGAGAFLSGPAAAVSANGVDVHLFGRGQDGRIWRAFSADGGRTWPVAWQPIGAGTFVSSPAAAVSADGRQVHVFGRGRDNKIWRAYSADGGATWAVAWVPIGEGAFTSAPAAAVSADGRTVHVCGRGQDGKFWRAYSGDGGATWAVAWAPIGSGVFTSSPAAAVSADGRRLHVFGRGGDNKTWRAYSADAGATWAVAWAPIGQGVFTSPPAATVSPDGNHLQVFGIGTDGQVWQADSGDGAQSWRVAWAPVPAAH